MMRINILEEMKMLKLSRKGLGLLNAQYRSVLRKCFLLNIIGAAALMPQQVHAAGAVINANGSGSADVNAFVQNLNSGMGNEIGDDKYVSELYVNKNFTDTVYSDTQALITGYSWLLNYQKVQIGYQINNGTVTPVAGGVTISNRHNTDADNIYFGGGVIANGGGSNYESTFNAYNSTFENNSSSYFGVTPNAITAGGVISNFSGGATIMSLNQFNQNYVMSINKAYGGAIYNGTTTENNGTIVQGIMNINDNTFTGNYAGNKTTDSKLENQMSGHTVAPEAAGGAIYNTGKFTSAGDTFIKNFAVGDNATGGAIYNGSDGATGTMTLINGRPESINFSRNHVESKDTAGYARGGAVFNGSELFSTAGYFDKNTAYGGNEAQGGAVYNSGRYISSDETYTNNRAYDAARRAAGGAVANTGSFTINGTSTYSANKVTGKAGQTNADIIGGGAIYNSGTLLVNGETDGNRYTVNLDSNQVSSGDGNAISVGGAVLTENFSDIKFTAITNNKTSGDYAGGAGLASMISNTNGSTRVSSSVFENNEATGASGSFGGAVYNGNTQNQVLTTITDTSFANNKALGSSATSIVAGGAIANGGLNGNSNITRLLISAQNNDVVFSNNSAGTTATSFNYGGALYNAENGQTTLQTDGKNITFRNNTADFGGAVYNVTEGLTQSVNGTSYTALFEARAENGDINFNNNTARKDGGAFYNKSDNGLHTNLYSADNGAINFYQNSAQNGGGIATAGNSMLLLTVGQNGKINLTENKAELNGGAVHNLGITAIVQANETQTSAVTFKNNTAQKGGAVYNAASGQFGGYLNKETSITFDANKASDKQGGAIYNEQNAETTFLMADKGKLIFNTTSDDVYNLGLVTITGDSPTRSIDENATQVILNSTFAGTGTYTISSTQLNIGSTGYIDFEPIMELNNVSVNLASSSYLNLDTTDTLTDNNFDISRNAILTYRASEDKPDVTLADNINNSGVLNLNDGVLSTVVINTLTSNNGTIRIDVNNPTYTADVITITDRIYGTTNIAFDNANTLTLEDQKIYFAQTQAEQSLDDYNFVSRINNGLYEIKIGHDNNINVEDWYFFRTDALNPEVIAYMDLPRAAIEQTRSLLFDISRLDKGGCACFRDECNYKVCNFRDNGEKSRVWAKPFYRSGSYDKPVETDITLWGLDAGYDVQTSISSQFGIFASYRNGTYENDGKGEKYYSNYGSELDINSAVAGAYYRKYFGDFYVSGAVYGGMLDVDIKADNGVSASTDGINLGAQVETGYDIRTTRRSVLTPSLRASYDYIKFDDLSDNSGKKVSFDTIQDIELELGVKFEYQFNNEHQLPTTGYIKPSVIQTIANGGEVKVNDFTFDETVDNETLGRIEIGADAELVKNFSVGAFGNYTFGSDYSAWAVGGNIRYVW